jgi:uncharacterized protein YjiS (DUF1127 family)
MLPPVDLAGFLALQQESNPPQAAQSAKTTRLTAPFGVNPARRMRVRRPRLDVFGRFLAWRRRRATRIVLSALDDRALRDIGLNRSEIDATLRSIETSNRR